MELRDSQMQFGINTQAQVSFRTPTFLFQFPALQAARATSALRFRRSVQPIVGEEHITGLFCQYVCHRKCAATYRWSYELQDLPRSNDRTVKRIFTKFGAGVVLL
jgi:hypothetical protein